jgi:hypothetical protein
LGDVPTEAHAADIPGEVGGDAAVQREGVGALGSEKVPSPVAMEDGGEDGGRR